MMIGEMQEFKSEYTGVFVRFVWHKKGKKRIKKIRLEDIKNLSGQYLATYLEFAYAVRFKKIGQLKPGDLIYFEHRFMFDGDASTWLIGSPSKIRKIDSEDEAARLRPVVREMKTDWESFRRYAKEHYNEDYSKVSDKEKEQFITWGDIIDKPYPVIGWLCGKP